MGRSDGIVIHFHGQRVDRITLCGFQLWGGYEYMAFSGWFMRPDAAPIRTPSGAALQGGARARNRAYG
jgi:hypothetical protein